MQQAMQIYKAPLRDMRFVLHELLDDDGFGGLPGYEEFTPDLIDAVLEEAAKLCAGGAAAAEPHRRRGRLHARERRRPHAQGLQGSLRPVPRRRLGALAADPEYGGQGLPETVNKLVEEMICAANLVVRPLSGPDPRRLPPRSKAMARDELKQTYLPKMVEGTWSGTMCLTEPHCGTDLGLLRTKAVPQADGSYRITGTKIFISAGEHDLTENIIHLVLARLPDAPAGMQGHQPVPRAQIPAQGRRHARRAQRRRLRRASSTRWASRPRPPAS